MKLTDEIAAAPFKFKEVQIKSFDCNAQQGYGTLKPERVKRIREQEDEQA